MYINGCARLICFRENLPDYLHLVKLGDDDHDDSALLANLQTEIVRKCMTMIQVNSEDLRQ